MYNTITTVWNGIQAALVPMGLPVHKGAKPESDLGACMSVSYVPIKKNEIESWNDFSVILYLPKISGSYDTKNIGIYCGQIKTYLLAFGVTNGITTVNEDTEPTHYNMDGFSASEYRFRIRFT